MKGRIYYDSESDGMNMGFAACVPDAEGCPSWQLDDGSEEELIAQATASSAFYCNERVEEWVLEPYEETDNKS